MTPRPEMTTEQAEHIWHRVSPLKQGPKELTGMVKLTRDADGSKRARLLDLVPGRSGIVYTQWLKERGDAFRAGVKIATLDLFRARWVSSPA